MKRIIFCICIIFIFFNCKNNVQNSNKFSISGAFALYPLACKWTEEFSKIDSHIKIDISAGGAGKGITDVLSNMVEIGMSSRDINEAEIKKGAFFIKVARDAVVLTVNENNPFLESLERKGIRKDELFDIWITGKIKNWGSLDSIKSNDKIILFTRSDACGASEIWAKLFDRKQEDLLGIGVYGDPGVSNSVRNEKYSLGYNNIAFAFDIRTHKPKDGLRVLPIDFNSNFMIDSNEYFYGDLRKLNEAIQSGKYPSPPARYLYFVFNQKPKNESILKFLNWIFEDGQKFVTEMGYVPLSSKEILEQKEKLIKE